MIHEDLNELADDVESSTPPDHTTIAARLRHIIHKHTPKTGPTPDDNPGTPSGGSGT